MKKQVVSLLLALALVFTALVPAALASDDGYYYVYTENGKGLNVRSTPGGDVVGSLPYGTRIYCYYRDGGNGWALIDYYLRHLRLLYLQPFPAERQAPGQALPFFHLRSGGHCGNERGIQERETGDALRRDHTAGARQRLGEPPLGAEQGSRDHGNL